TMTTSCPACSKALLVDDVVVKTVQSVRKIQTCGRLGVHKKGRVIAQTGEAHQGVEVEGIMEANVLSGGPVRIRPTAQWEGDCHAPSVSIEEGCRITGGHFLVPDHSLGVEDLLEVQR